MNEPKKANSLLKKNEDLANLQIEGEEQINAGGFLHNLFFLKKR